MILSEASGYQTNFLTKLEWLAAVRVAGGLFLLGGCHSSRWNVFK